MNILFNFINHETAIVDIDFRAEIFTEICKYLAKKGHKIYIDRHKKSGHPSFKRYKEFLRSFSQYEGQKIDLWIVPYAQHLKEDRYTKFSKGKIPIIIYEHGWLFESVMAERGRLFSDSPFADILSEISEKEFNLEKCNKYKNSLLSNNISKRPQTHKDKIPDSIKDKYIFVPIQKINDVSVERYSKIPMLEFMSKVVKFASQLNIPVVFKPHPHIKADYKTIRNQIRKFQKTNKNIYEINTSVYNLMQNALFTACINSGTVIDNFVTQTPVYCCGKSMFYKSGTVIYDRNVEKGLRKMFEKGYDSNQIKIKQLQVLWWLKQNLLFANLDARENTKRLAKYSQINF